MNTSIKLLKKQVLANFTRSLIFQCTWPFHYFVFVCLFVAECRQLLRRKQAHLCCCDDMSVWPLVEVPARPIVDALSLSLTQPFHDKFGSSTINRQIVPNIGNSLSTTT